MRITVEKEEQLTADLMPKAHMAANLIAKKPRGESYLGLKTNVAIENSMDIRICDGSHVIKVSLDCKTNKILSLLVDDIFVWTAKQS